MRLVDFIICVLEAHALTLQRLAAFFGEEKLLEMLEAASDEENPPRQSGSVVRIHPEWLEPARGGASPSSIYAELESSVHEMHLPSVLEFYLWAYPHYRAFIESPVDFSTRIRGSGSDAGIALVDEAVAQAEAWIKKLPIPPGVAPAAERAAQIPWLRFRSTVLKRIGKRPLGPVY